ncbi:gas vesicle protein GvpJ [Acrasis kona]
MFTSHASTSASTPTNIPFDKFEEALGTSPNDAKVLPDETESSDVDEVEQDETIISAVDPFLDMANKIRVKLIVSETSKNNFERTIKRVISPFVNMDFHKAPFGFFHIALAVGCWKIEWNSSELCIPRTVTGQASIVCADVEAIADLDKLDLVRDKLADVIVKWNTTMHYKQRGGNPEMDHNGNCQQFIDEIMQCLDLSSCYTQFPAPLVNYIKRLRQDGRGEMDFELDADFKSKFFPPSRPRSSASSHNDTLNLEDQTPQVEEYADVFDLYKSKSKITFKTHEQLDRFVCYLQSIEPQFKYLYKHEYYLLKSFDRAYWMRYIKDSSNSTYEPHMQDDVEICPFSDPQGSSILPFSINK